MILTNNAQGPWVSDPTPNLIVSVNYFEQYADVNISRKIYCITTGSWEEDASTRLTLISLHSCPTIIESTMAFHEVPSTLPVPCKN